MNNLKAPLGVAVVGLGVGEQHAIMYSTLSDCSLRLLYDIDTDKARSIASRLGCQTAKTFEQIIDDRKIEIVSIASFDDSHGEQILACLHSGKHVFVEKPMCNTFKELKTINNAWRKQKGQLKLFSNHILRAAPIYIWLKEKIEDGTFGEIYAFDGDYLYGRLWKVTNGWRKDEIYYSAMNSGGLHLIDLMIWLTGQRPLSVSTVGNRICARNTEFKQNDFMASTFRFESGLVGRITANLGCVHRHHHIMRIFGDNATFIYDDAGPRLHLTRDPNLNATPVFLETLPKTKGDLIPFFVNAIVEDKAIDARTQEIFDDISITSACDKALELSSEVEIEYI